jgi:large subunit ribosomal protein L22
MAPRKVRLVANMIKGLSVPQAKAQLQFLVKKPASLILKLVNSAAANAKQNLAVEEDNLMIDKVLVEAGPTMKRWLPRAMGRASAIHKRTCSIKLFLREIEASSRPKKAKVSRPEVVKEDEAWPAEAEKRQEKVVADKETKPKGVPPARPYGSSGQAKSRYFSRQTFGNIKKIFRRKSI